MDIKTIKIRIISLSLVAISIVSIEPRSQPYCLSPLITDPRYQVDVLNVEMACGAPTVLHCSLFSFNKNHFLKALSSAGLDAVVLMRDGL